jgi:hypothetical protein
MMLQPYASNFERIWHWSHRSLCGLVLLFLMLPVLVMIPLSFNGGAFLVYPLQGWSLRWYETFFTSPEWMRGWVPGAKSVLNWFQSSGGWSSTFQSLCLSRGEK